MKAVDGMIAPIEVAPIIVGAITIVAVIVNAAVTLIVAATENVVVTVTDKNYD